MNLTQKTTLTLILATSLFTGCASTVSTQSAMDTVNIPEQWQSTKATDSTHSTLTPEKWWTTFNDPRLSALIEKALDTNADLRIAGYKLKSAELSAGLAQNNLYPSISASASGNASRALNTSSAKTNQSYSTGISVGYEVDLWGKLAQSATIKQWEAQATAQDLRATQLSIEGSVAKLYWQIALLNQKIKFSNESTAYARKVLDLVRVQYKAGAVSQIEVLSSERSLASQEANQAELAQQLSVARNAMAVLFDAPHSAHIIDEPQSFPSTHFTHISPDLPVQVLARRPDVQAAELRLRQSLGNIDIARSNFYPTISLNGKVSTGANTLSQILSDPLGALGASLALPILNWNENQLNLKISKNAYEQNVVSFRQTLYSALQDVDDTLSAQTQLRIQGEKQAIAWHNAQKTEHLYEVRYRAGAEPLKSWLDATETRRQTEQAYLTNVYNQYVNHVDLILALGGGL